MKTLGFLLFLLSSTEVFAQEEESLLMDAYQKEFVFLDSEIRQLDARKKEVAADGEERVRKARAGLVVLEARLLALSSESARFTESLRIVEEEGQKSQDAFDLAQSIKSQGVSKSRDAGMLSFDESPEGKRSYKDSGERLLAELEYAFKGSMTLLDHASTITKCPGQFYLDDGKQVEGQVLKFGRIGAMGLAGDQGGTLAPSGAGQLKLARAESKDQVKTLLENERAPLLPLFIFQGFDKNVDTNIGKTFQDILDAGGPVGFVIIFLGIAGLILGVIRAWVLRSLRVQDKQALEELMELVKSKKLEKARKMTEKVGGALGRVLSGTLQGLLVSEKKVEDAISAAILKEQGKIDIFRSVITVFAAVAPLLGLLGTVTGMIGTFDIITLYGTGDPKLLSGGISEALVTTEFGLMVAIPLLLLGNILSSFADGINSELEISALRLLNLHEEAKSEAS